MPMKGRRSRKSTWPAEGARCDLHQASVLGPNDRAKRDPVFL